MAQSWHDLLFAHWPVDAAVLRPLLPPQLQIDTFEGHAWLAVVPFHMTGVRLRGAPAVPWLSAFPELSVRTYVTCGGKPGVWFFCLDAGNSLAVAIARAWFHLPYFRARMSCAEREGWIHYQSVRTHRGAPAGLLKGRYRSVGEAFSPHRGTLEYFLTERYCLYATDGRGQSFAARFIIGRGSCRWRKPSLPGMRWRKRRESRYTHESLYSILRRDRMWSSGGRSASPVSPECLLTTCEKRRRRRARCTQSPRRSSIGTFLPDT